MEYMSKKDFTRAIEGMLAPIRDSLLTCEGQPDFGHTAAVYPQDAVYAEAFLRPLWGLVPYWYGGGGDEELKSAMRRGVICGTDPKNSHYWGVCSRFDQRFVEMAPLATALLFVPEIMWEPLTEEEKTNLYQWMWQINEHSLPDNNWRFFRILTNLAFQRLGVPYSADRLDEDRCRIEDFYLGDGWYSDGPSGQRDYYVAWAFHYYGLIYACFENDAYAEKYRARAKVFAEQFIYWFSDYGPSIPYGRSLTYRLAQGSFWSMYALAGIEGYDYGVVKGILSRHLSDWLSSPIFDNAGVLSVGYKYPNLMMAEHYNAPGSPYWAMKFFAYLALPDDHPFWTAEVKPLPPLDAVKPLPVANMLATRYRGDAFNYTGATIERAAFGQVGAKYLKFVYSTRFGFNLKLGDAFDIESLADSTLMFDVGGVFCDRRTTSSVEVRDDRVITTWSPINGITVTTEIIPDGASHTRRHTINSAYDCFAYDCGFAIDRGDEMHCQSVAEDTTYAEVKNDTSLCRVSGEGGTPLVVLASPNANVTYTKSSIPAVKYTIPQGCTTITTCVEVEIK